MQSNVDFCIISICDISYEEFVKTKKGTTIALKMYVHSTESCFFAIVIYVVNC